MPLQTFGIHIPKPCHQSWDEMQPAGKGRHCLSCNKTVIDFSVMDDQQVQNYFSNATQGICGRFKKAQLDRIRVHIPSYIFNKPIAAWKKYLVILLVCFGSSLLPVDVALGNTKYATEFVQGTPQGQSLQTNKKEKKKEKKKKRSRKKKAGFIFYTGIDINTDFKIYTMGFTVSVKDPFEINLLDNLFSSDSSSLKYFLANNKKTEKKTPQKSNDENKVAFIIPAAFSTRRRKNKPL